MNKNAIGAVILSDKALIIKMYQDNMRVTAIAAKYGVVESTIYMHLKKWGVSLKRGVWTKQAKKPRKHWKRKVSPELLAQRGVNSCVNSDPKKGIKYIEFVKTTRDQELVHNIINHPLMTV